MLRRDYSQAQRRDDERRRRKNISVMHHEDVILRGGGGVGFSQPIKKKKTFSRRSRIAQFLFIPRSMKLFLTLLACWTLRRRYSYSKLSLNRSRNLLSRSLCVMLALFKASADTFDAKYCTTLRAKSELAARACRSLNSIQSVPSCEFSIIPTQALTPRMREFAFHNIIITSLSTRVCEMVETLFRISYFFFRTKTKTFSPSNAQ